MGGDLRLLPDIVLEALVSDGVLPGKAREERMRVLSMPEAFICALNGPVTYMKV
jgi:hypothetical protein